MPQRLSHKHLFGNPVPHMGHPQTLNCHYHHTTWQTSASKSATTEKSYPLRFEAAQIYSKYRAMCELGDMFLDAHIYIYVRMFSQILNDLQPSIRARPSEERRVVPQLWRQLNWACHGEGFHGSKIRVPKISTNTTSPKDKDPKIYPNWKYHWFHDSHLFVF